MKIVKISALWCLSCIIMSTRVKEIADKHNIELIELDYDFDEEKVMKFNPGKILPVLIFLDEHDNEISRLNGEKTEKEILNIIEV